MKTLKADDDNRVEHVIFDIDGVLADITHRLHMCPGRPGVENTDWDIYHAAGVEDPEIKVWTTLATMLYSSGYRVVLATNRPESARQYTEAWLTAMMVPFDRMLMREDNEHHGDKQWVLEKLMGERVVLAFDDDPRHVEMYRAAGVPCCYVHSGYYEELSDEHYYNSGYVRSRGDEKKAGVTITNYGPGPLTSSALPHIWD